LNKVGKFITGARIIYNIIILKQWDRANGARQLINCHARAHRPGPWCEFYSIRLETVFIFRRFPPEYDGPYCSSWPFHFGEKNLSPIITHRSSHAQHNNHSKLVLFSTKPLPCVRVGGKIKFLKQYMRIIQ